MPSSRGSYQPRNGAQVFTNKILLVLFTRWLSGKKSICANAETTGDGGLILGLGRSTGGGNWQATPGFLPGGSPWTEEPGGLQSMGVTKSWTD